MQVDPAGSMQQALECTERRAVLEMLWTVGAGPVGGLGVTLRVLGQRTSTCRQSQMQGLKLEGFRA